MSYRWPPDWMLREYLWYYQQLIERVNWAAGAFPDIGLSSWFRDEASNAAVGGHPFSQHRLGFAVDLTTAWKGELADRIRSAGLIPLVEGDHVHVQIFLAGTLPKQLFQA